ncbi:MAG: AMP-binding protein, partial [Actinomycetes bacterium]
MTPTDAVDLEIVDAPRTSDEVAAFVPRLARALAGGEPLMPVPASGVERDRLLEGARDAQVPHGTALVVPTSGSTGAPRLAQLSGLALVASADATQRALGGPGRWLLSLPTTHIAGLQVLVRSLRSQRDPVVVDATDGFTAASFVEAVASLDKAASELPHYTSLVPTQLQRLLDDGAGLEALWELDAVLVGGAAVPGALLDRARDAGVTVVRTYGMTETCGGCVYDGVPLDGVDVAVDASGRVSIAGPVLFDRYLGASKPAVVDGWFTTNDIGRQVDGVLHVDGRADNIIVSGGVNVPAEAVERALFGVAEIGEAIVIGVPDEEWGDRVVAMVTAKEAIEVAVVREALQVVVPAAWMPRDVLTLEAL